MLNYRYYSIDTNPLILMYWFQSIDTTLLILIILILVYWYQSIDTNPLILLYWCIDCVVLILWWQDDEFEWDKQTQGIILGGILYWLYCIDFVMTGWWVWVGQADTGNYIGGGRFVLIVLYCFCHYRMMSLSGTSRHRALYWGSFVLIVFYWFCDDRMVSLSGTSRHRELYRGGGVLYWLYCIVFVITEWWVWVGQADTGHYTGGVLYWLYCIDFVITGWWVWVGQADTGHYPGGVFLGLPDHPDTGRLAGGEVWRQEGVWVLHVDDGCGHFTDTCWRQTQSIRPARSQSGQGTGRGRHNPYKRWNISE